MIGKTIGGIQQIGIGIRDLDSAFKWYRRVFGVDVPIFEDRGEAGLMLHYTGGEPRARRAVLALNLQGGSAFEIWQYTQRQPQAPAFPLQVGDLGIFAARIKAWDVEKAFEQFSTRDISLLGGLSCSPGGARQFFMKDPFENIFQIVPGNDWFTKIRHSTGGTCGCMIGVSDISRALPFYDKVLGYDRVLYDESGSFEDLAVLPGGGERLRRVLLSHREKPQGPFSRLYGTSQLELVQVLSREPKKIFANRYWGDLGFIHLCFDVKGMQALKAECAALGFPFTVDSNASFDMGEAAGHFTYTEDPDGTLIEFVEAHRIPIIKKLGWYLDLRRRNPIKPLPDWMLKALSFSRVKD
jgi:catechol 2,3-dioxygenase-like lactoylglutathione lyase family enzyme